MKPPTCPTCGQPMDGLGYRTPRYECRLTTCPDGLRNLCRPHDETVADSFRLREGAAQLSREKKDEP